MKKLWIIMLISSLSVVTSLTYARAAHKKKIKRALASHVHDLDTSMDIVNQDIEQDAAQEGDVQVAQEVNPPVTDEVVKDIQTTEEASVKGPVVRSLTRADEALPIEHLTTTVPKLRVQPIQYEPEINADIPLSAAEISSDSDVPFKGKHATAEPAIINTHVEPKALDEDTLEEYEPLEEVVVEKPLELGARGEVTQPEEVITGATSVVPAPIAPFSLGKHDFNEKAKRRDVINLLNKAINYMQTHSLDESMSAFTHGKDFRKGELYLFVFDLHGVCMAHGQQTDLLWQNMYNAKDTYGSLFVQMIIERGRAGGGWVTYNWRNATKVSYVKMVQKEGGSYIIGCGYYPHSKSDAVVTLVKGAVALFNEAIHQDRSLDQVFSTLSYPLGNFVYGDLYLYALDFSGIQLAHGELPGIVGTDALNYQDANGKYVNKEIMAKLKDVGFGVGVWVDYISKNAVKRAYAEKVADKEGKLYFIACGYYPDADRTQAINLVRRGYKYMKSNGKTQAVRAFTDKGDDEFRYGDLYLTVYDLRGVCVANGSNATMIGRNFYNAKDEYGAFYVREMIKKALSGGGWIDYKEKNSFKSAYVEKINLGVEEFVIMCGVYPVTKREVMLQLTKSAADYFKLHALNDALYHFVKKDSKFIRGDLEIIVYDSKGILLADGDNYDVIWKNMMQAVDDQGKPYVRTSINTVAHGSGIVTYHLEGATRVSFVEPVTKNGKLYIVASGFYI